MNDCSQDSASGRGRDDSREVEQALATLRPNAAGIDRDRLMFMAGRAMGEGHTAGSMLFSKWLWPSATAVSTIAASVLGLLLALSYRPLVVREQVYVHAPQATQPTAVFPQPINAQTGSLPPGMVGTATAPDVALVGSA